MFISQALAATDEAVQGAAAEPFYLTTEFFVGAAFVLFFVFFGKQLMAAVNVKLDERALRIKEQLDDAARLRDEAQELLASYEKKQHEALKDAQNIVQAAREEAQRLSVEAAQQLEHNLERAEQLAQERIALAETQALDAVKALAISVAMDTAERVLKTDLPVAKRNAIIDQSIRTLEDKLQ